MWKHRYQSKEHVAILWALAERMPTHAKRRIHDRLRRFLVNTNLLPTRITHITVPCNDPKNFNQVKIMTRLHINDCCKTDAIRSYMLSHVQVHKGRGENISDAQGQRQSAHNTSGELCKFEAEFPRFKTRSDLSMIDLHWDRHIIDNSQQIVDKVALELATMR